MDDRDVQQWMGWLLGRYSGAYADQVLSALERACAGRSFTQRRDTAIIAVFTATGIRLSDPDLDRVLDAVDHSLAY